VRLRFSLLTISITTPDPPETQAPQMEASGGHNFERAEPRRIGFTGDDDLPDHEGKRK
jgi:hypothetical protein